MDYQIINNGANIKFIAGGKEFSLEKMTVKEIRIIREDIIRISTGNCFSSIFIRQQKVVEPITVNATELVVILNYMMTVNENSPSQISE